MSKQEKFYDLSAHELPPINRRVYDAAKLPFAYLAEFLWWVSSPWRRALPLAIAGAAILCLVADGKGSFWIDFATVGLVATAVLGVGVVILDVLRAIFE